MTDLIVAAGETQIIDDPAVDRYFFDRLVLEAKSILLLKQSVTIEALEAEFNGGTIELSGSNGLDGASALDHQPPPASDCEPGHDGGNGQPGRPGENARSISIKAGLSRFGSLTIRANGGNGGMGGNGQPGGKGGAAHCGRFCDGQDGGRGGNGGDGGSGGSGGQVEYEWYDTGVGQLPPGLPGGHKYEANPGIGGIGGSGRDGGHGGDGADCALFGRAGGNAGRPGHDGRKGRGGDHGWVHPRPR